MSSMPAAVAGFISDGRVGRLGTADATGQPLVVPICYAWDGAALFSALDAKPKSRPVERSSASGTFATTPRSRVVIDRYDEDWTELRYVIIQGEARLLTEGRRVRARRRPPAREVPAVPRHGARP